MNILVPSFRRTTAKKDDARLYVAIDSDDFYYNRYLKVIQSVGTVVIVNKTALSGRIPFNEITQRAQDDGAEYIVRVNDDTEFVTNNWVQIGKDALRKMDPPNVGVVVDTRNMDFVTLTKKYEPSYFLNPSKCDGLSIVIPYRDREFHKLFFLNYMKHYFNKYFLTTPITYIIVEQENKDLFNRGLLTNVGIKKILTSNIISTCIIQHDIDRVPITFVDYCNCKTPIQLSSENRRWNYGVPYPSYSGGIVSLSVHDWKKINGMSNNYKGWGGEDDDLYLRLQKNGLLNGTYISRPPKGSGTFYEFIDNSHTSRQTDKLEYKRTLQRLTDMRRGSYNWKGDGLSSISTSKIVSKEMKENNIFHLKCNTVFLHHLSINGRLGNQLFQWASTHGIANKHGMIPCVFKSTLGLAFDIPYDMRCASTNSFPVLNENHKYAIHNDYIFDGNSQLDGYLQSFKYFHPNLRNILQFKPAVINMALEYIDTWKHKVLVGIHVRHKYEESYLRFPTNEYFKSSMDFFRSNHSNVHFIVISDDPSWCQKNTVFQTTDVTVNTAVHNPAVDMAILSKCKHIILTIGSFGWWAAFLGPDYTGGDVIYYKDAFKMDHPTNKGNVVLQDHYPANWTGVNNDFGTVQQKNLVCMSKLTANMPVNNLGVMKAHHWDARTNKWNENERWTPMNLKQPCSIWYVGANTHGRDGRVLQERYGCHIHIFEPILPFRQSLTQNWKSVTNKTIYDYGLGGKTKFIKGIKVEGESTFAMSSRSQSGETVFIRDVLSVFVEKKYAQVSLLHMNCEGCEWELLERLISANLLPFINILQIGTHLFPEISNIKFRYCEIESKLALSHTKVFQQYFGWERWSLKKEARLIKKDTMPSNFNFIRGTIVTAYFKMRSKHTYQEYDTWIKNFMSLNDNMIIYTTYDMVPEINKLRFNLQQKTKIIITNITELKMYKEYNDMFWRQQHLLDPEKRIHQDKNIYIIWNEKTEWLLKGVLTNPFNSNFFVWMDIGYFRTTMYNNQQILRYVPKSLNLSQVIMLDVNSIIPKSWGQYIGGGFIGGYSEGIKMWHKRYYSTLQQNKGYFIGKDQPWMWKTCQNNIGLCKLIKPDKNHGDPWFFMTPYLLGLTNDRF